METGVEKIDFRQTYNCRYIKKLSSIGRFSLLILMLSDQTSDLHSTAAPDGSKLRIKRDFIVFVDKADNWLRLEDVGGGS
jgi:hypothetical protein